jgi:flagellar biosynthesis protein FliQ
MNEASAQLLAALELSVRFALPLLGAAFGVALVLAILQGLFRLPEPGLNSIPRALVTLLVLAAVGPWLSSELVTYSRALFRALPELVR